MGNCGKILYIFTPSNLNNCVMAVFIGEHSCKIDSKGRMLLPSSFKKQLPPEAQDKFVVKKDVFENCLVLFPMDEWERQVAIVRAKLNPYNKEHNKFLRGFYRGTAELELDSSNRLLIPKRLLEVIEAKKELVLAGQDGKIEIWAKEAYDNTELGDDEFANLAEKILGDSLTEE